MVTLCTGQFHATDKSMPWLRFSVSLSLPYKGCANDGMVADGVMQAGKEERVFK